MTVIHEYTDPDLRWCYEPQLEDGDCFECKEKLGDPPYIAYLGHAGQGKRIQSSDTRQMLGQDTVADSVMVGFHLRCVPEFIRKISRDLHEVMTYEEKSVAPFD